MALAPPTGVPPWAPPTFANPVWDDLAGLPPPPPLGGFDGVVS